MKETTLHNGEKVMLVEVPEDAQNFIVDNSLEFLIYNIPNYKNWVTDDVLENPFKIDEYLAKTPQGEDWLRTGKRLHGKFKLLGTFQDGIFKGDYILSPAQRAMLPFPPTPTKYVILLTQTDLIIKSHE